MSEVFTKVESQVLSPVMLSYAEGIHDSVVIEGIERRCRIFERSVPSENEVWAAIASLLKRGIIARNDGGWLVHVAPKAAS